MSDDLVVSGSGSNSVATDELYANAQQLGALAASASVMSMQLAWIDRIASVDWLTAAGAPVGAVSAEHDIDMAKVLIAEIEIQAKFLQYSLNTAADGYGFVEMVLAFATRGLVGDAAGVFGSIWPTALGGLGVAGAAGLVAGIDEHDASRAFTNPATVSLAREGVMAADDAMLGALGVPRPLAALLGDQGLGVTGVAFGASALVLGGSAVGAFRETGVRAASSKVTSVAAPPAGFTERLDRIPDPPPSGGAQVVIEKYEQAGQPDRFEVYIAGTVRFDSFETSEPWDMTSNLSNATGEGGGSYDSVVAAMREAGIDQSSPVQFTGYSQGGGTAALLAASGDYNTRGLVTFGGPTGQVSLPTDIPSVIVEHTDDIVPALGGSQENRSAVIVEREVYDDRAQPDGLVMPAHHLFNYRETAVLMDGARSDQIRSTIATLDQFGRGATTITSTAYRFERVNDPS